MTLITVPEARSATNELHLDSAWLRCPTLALVTRSQVLARVTGVLRVGKVTEAEVAPSVSARPAVDQPPVPRGNATRPRPLTRHQVGSRHFQYATNRESA